MPCCGLCAHFSQTHTAKLWHTCKLFKDSPTLDPAQDACEHYRDKSAQQSILNVQDMRPRGAFRAACELEQLTPPEW